MSVSVRRVHVVLSTAGFKGGGKPCHKTRETAALRRGIHRYLCASLNSLFSVFFILLKKSPDVPTVASDRVNGPAEVAAMAEWLRRWT